MSRFTSKQTLPGSRIRCRETNDELVLYVPPHHIWGLISGVVIVAILVVIMGLLTLWTYGVGWWGLLCSVPFAMFALLFLGLFFWAIVGNSITSTWVLITRKHLVLTTKVWGREHVETYPLNEKVTPTNTGEPHANNDATLPAARSGAWLPPIGQRQRKRPCKHIKTACRPPQGAVCSVRRKEPAAIRRRGAKTP